MIAINSDKPLDIEQTLGTDGPIAAVCPGFEPRPEQIHMAKAVQKSFEKGQHLAVEAGTGTGKSFAYLIPAIDRVHRDDCRVLISTYTINLQEQLINKDIPLLASALNQNFTACLAKGRQNYLCQRRLEYAQRKQKGLFDKDAGDLAEISQWAANTEDGSLSDMDFVPAGQVWDAVKSEHGNCRGRKCGFFRECFYFKARRQLETANIIIANHALMFSDLLLKESTPGILPEYQYVIVDEAHNLEHTAEEHLGINITNFTILYLLRGLYNGKANKGLLVSMKANECIELVRKTADAADCFFRSIQEWHSANGYASNGRCSADFVQDNITEQLRELRLALSRLVKDCDDEDDKFEINRFVDRLKAIEGDLKKFIHQPPQDNEHIYWVEVSSGRINRIQLRSAPIDVGPDVKRFLFDSFRSVVTTSATLSCGGGDKQSFGFFAERVGMRDFSALKLGSPFDYESQVTMYIEPNLPEPNNHGFLDKAAEALKKYILKTHGKAFVLFTSYSMLRNFSNKLSPWLAEHDITLLEQGSGINRSTMLDYFREDTNSVLFGTDSFWQGVDVPGDALSNVIIMRLPFAVPNHPLVQGRIEKIRQEGGQPFFKYQLPSAIIKFKQGFGRLIRKRTDHGIVVVLDSRIIQKGYGRQFIEAIPKCRIEIAGRD